MNLEIKNGSFIGIIGLNGSGKSTLSNVLAGILTPDYGEVSIDGTISLLGVSAGLNPNLTGRDNIYQKCLYLGYSIRQIKRIEKQIIEFAEINGFIDEPVKNYSAGMKARLGFAIAIQNTPNVLIIDEALSVGDANFYGKCLNEINRLNQLGSTIIFISHSLAQIEAVCQETIWIHEGKIKQRGATAKVIKAYKLYVAEYKKNRQKLSKRLYEKAEIKKRPQKGVKKVEQFVLGSSYLLLLILLLYSLSIIF
ncbi:ABC transporter ATP-binding protein [Enterococcus villorum]|uniref:ABC transporter ATP-binding protein n=1 Tax=Enterococcus villorum TaxID=112904 RepID=UPI0009DC0F15|nr:ATP-binding cassette domain-containing protein [Enterococcus villorum]